MVIHEVAHGTAANYLGDDTAKIAGRLTLNPIKHLDPIGSVVVPLLLIISNAGIVFGWAKPVPVNPSKLRDQKYGDAKVALAGPLANLAVALVFGIILRIAFNFDQFPYQLATIFSYIVFINILLAIFNLVPIPPLDGSHILFTFLPDTYRDLKIFLSQYGFIILIFFIFFLFRFLFPFISFIYKGIVGAPLII